MEIELNLNPNISQLTEIKKESQKKEIEISDFIMIIDEIINQNSRVQKDNIDKNTEIIPTSSQVQKIQNENEIKITQDDEIFSEFELQLIKTQKTNTILTPKEIINDNSTQINKEKNNETFNIKAPDKKNQTEIETIKTTEISKKDIFTKEETFIKKDLPNLFLKNKDEDTKTPVSKDTNTNEEKNLTNTKYKNTEKLIKEEIFMEKINSNEEKKHQTQLSLQPQTKNQNITIQKTIKELETYPNIFKKEEKNQIKEDFSLLNTKNEEKDQKYEKTQETITKTTQKEIPEQRLERKKFELNDDKIGKIKMIFNSNSKEMEIKITTHDKEIFKQINETKNQLANEITKNVEIEKTNIKINLEDENQNSKKQNQENSKNNKKLNKQKKEKFELV